MHITDPIADMLTRIRNANSAKHDTVDIPASNMKKAIAQILVDEGYIKNYKIIEDGKQGVIRVTLKYGEGKSQVITIQGNQDYRLILSPRLRQGDGESAHRRGLFRIRTEFLTGSAENADTITNSDITTK